jgi:hypothetical protein
MFTTELSLALMLIMAGAIPLLPQYVFMACIGKLHIYLEIKINELVNRKQITSIFNLFFFNYLLFQNVFVMIVSCTGLLRSH